MSDEARVIGVDVGGTKVLGGVVDAGNNVLSVIRRRTPHRELSPQVVQRTIVEVIRELSRNHEVAAVGVGAAGFVDADGSRVRFSPHLAWRDEPLLAALEARLDLPVVVDNDANTTALAECRLGAGRGFAHVLCVTLGTGIGGALVVDGTVVRGANGMAGEFGHMQVVPQGLRCQCGNDGCWEQYASGNALVRVARSRLASSAPAMRSIRGLVGDDPRRLTGELVTEAARAGDLAAAEVLDEIGGWLGLGLANLTAAFDPEVIVVGGGLAETGELLLGAARRTLRRTLTGRGFRAEPDLVPASLGVNAGLIGASLLARSRSGRSA